MFGLMLPDWSTAGHYKMAYINSTTREILFGEVIDGKIKAFSGQAELIAPYWKLFETKHFSNNNFNISFFHSLFNNTTLCSESKYFIKQNEQQKSISFYLHFVDKEYTKPYYSKLIQTILHSIPNTIENNFISIYYIKSHFKIQYSDSYIKISSDNFNISELSQFLLNIQLRATSYINFEECFKISLEQDFEKQHLKKQLINF